MLQPHQSLMQSSGGVWRLVEIIDSRSHLLTISRALTTMNLTASHILPLKSDQATRARVGGKGRSLAQLAAVRLPIPDGFLVTTDTYQPLVQKNGLTAKILETLADTDPEDRAAVSRAANQITDAGLADLKGLTRLETLRLFNCTQVTDAGVAELEQALPNCKITK